MNPITVAEQRPVLDLGGQHYEWVEDWATLPETESRRAAWPHTRIVATTADRLVTFDLAESNLITLTKGGQLAGVVPVAIEEAHGITLVVDDGVEFLWLADAAVTRSDV